MEERFAFGKNWQEYAKLVSEERIETAVQHIRTLLRVDRLDGKRVLDIGCGSGLFSLAATRMGASVYAFDYDLDSVFASKAMRQRFHLEKGQPEELWHIEQGSVLDTEYMARLGSFDIVYSWGVLHHTGDQWNAIDQACRAVSAHGTLAIALYNDQGWMSRFWTQVKRFYCSGTAGRYAVCAAFLPLCAVHTLFFSLWEHGNPLYTFQSGKERGMSPLHDWFDWLGGYPFEVSTPEKVVDFVHARGFLLSKIMTVGSSLRNNQYAFIRVAHGNTVYSE